MNKRNFFYGLGTKLALVVVALATVTFTSCEEEDFSIEVKINPAKVTLNTEVIYFNEAGVPSNVNNANVTYDGTSNNVIMGTEANPAIDKTVVVKAEFRGLSAEKQVKVQASANTTMTQNVTIFLVDNELDITEVAGKTATKTNWGAPANGEGVIGHNGKIWNENPNSFFVTIKGEFPTFDNQVVTKTEMVEGVLPKLSAIAESMIKGMNWNKDSKDSFEYTASAYSIFAAWYSKTTTEMTYTISTSDNVKIATVTAEKTTSSGIEFQEDAHPDHKGDWHKGHGTGHGDAENAGGGIIFAD